MPLLENLVEGFAGAAGDQNTVNRIEKEKSNRTALSHAELQQQTQSILNDVTGLQTRRAALDPKSPTYAKDVGEIDANLHKARGALTDLYHPANNPDALQHLGSFIKQHLGGKKTVPATAGEAKQSMASTIAGLDIAAAAPGTPNEASKWTPRGNPYQDPNDKLWYQVMVDPTGATKKSAMPEGYTPPPSKAASKTGLKFDTATDEVVDLATGTRHPRGDPNNPPEVQAMFQGNTAATALKQKNAEHLAQVRGAAYGANRFVPVIDPKNPEAVTFMSAAKAASTGAHSPASISFQIDKAVTRAFTSGTPANNLNYFNTATNHLKLLAEAASALHNGNIPIFNKWAQRYASETGSAVPNNFNTVKAAVAGELSKTFKGTGATDEEVALIDGTINTAQSPEQLSGAIQYYTDLMAGKIDALRGQFEAAKKGQPNFPATAEDYIYAKDQQGKVHRAKKGTALPQGWTISNAPGTQ